MELCQNSNDGLMGGETVRRTTTFGLLGTLVACFFVFGGSDSWAQNREGASTELAEITVTARRRQESITEVPSSVAVVGTEAIDRLGITNFQDLALAIPNVSIFQTSNIAGRTAVTIRGIPDRAGIYVDDVFVGDATGISGLLVDVDRVEVVRGPQGALFGRNSISGAINTVTKRPSDTLQGDILLRAGNYDLRYVAGAVSGPVTEGTRAKLSGVYKSQSAFDRVRNFPKQRLADSTAVLAQTETDLTDDLKMLVSVDYLQDNALVSGVFDSIRDFGANGAYYRTAFVDGDGYDRVTPQQNRLSTADRKNIGGFLRFDWSGEKFGATSITASRDIKFEYRRDGDYSAYRILEDGYQPVDYKSFSQEFRVTWDPNESLSVLGGAYYFKDERNFLDQNTFGNDFVIAQASSPTFAAYAPAFTPGGTVGGVTNGRLVTSPELRALVAARLATSTSANLREFGRLVGLNQIDPNQLGQSQTRAYNQLASLSFFTTITARPTDRLELTGGLRYTREQIEAAFSRDVVGLYRLLSFTNPRIALPETTDNNVSPSASVKYTINPDVTVYATYSTGFRSGGYNTSPGAAVTDPVAEGQRRKFKPEKVTNYEIGAKATFSEGRVLLTGAIYQMHYKDLQRVFYRTDPVNGQVTQTLNTTATSKGGEIEVIFRLPSGLSGGLAYGYADSTYDDYPLGPVNTTLGTQQVVLTGRELPFTPRHTVAANLRYQHALTDAWDYFGSVDVQSRAPYRVTDYNNGIDPEIEVGTTTLLNGGFGLTNESAKLSISLRVTNATDEIYRTNFNINTFPGAVQQALSDPRTYSLEVRKSF